MPPGVTAPGRLVPGKGVFTHIHYIADFGYLVVWWFGAKAAPTQSVPVWTHLTRLGRKQSPRRDLNPRPSDYESDALPVCATEAPETIKTRLAGADSSFPLSRFASGSRWFSPGATPVRLGASLKRDLRLAGGVTHLVIADCAQSRVPAAALAQGFKALATGSEKPQLFRVTRLDLEKGPRLNRFKTLVGIGWHAREVLPRLADETGKDVEAVIEICGCGDHHLLGLGRAGVPAVRWVPAKASGRPDRLDVLASREGARLCGGSVAYAERVPGTQVPCIPLPEDESEAENDKENKRLVDRAVEGLLELMDEERGVGSQ